MNHTGAYKETTYQSVSELGLLNGRVVDGSAYVDTDNEEKPPTPGGEDEAVEEVRW